MRPIVEAEHLGRWYGPRRAVTDVSFTIRRNEVVGLLGPNGSGKSSILRMLTGYLSPSEGRVLLEGEDMGARAPHLRARIGYVPEDAPLYDGMRVRELLHFMAGIRGLGRTQARRRAAVVVEQMSLEPVWSTVIGRLSRGYRQRVAIAQALLADPPLLVLDEPTNGLDPQQIIELRELIRALGEAHTVLVASHVLTEIERTAARVMILLEGRLAAEHVLPGAREARREQGGGTDTQAPGKARVWIRGEPAAVEAVLARALGSRQEAFEREGAADGGAWWRIALPDGESSLAGVARAVVESGLELLALTPHAPTLEDRYLEVTRAYQEQAS